MIVVAVRMREVTTRTRLKPTTYSPFELNYGCARLDLLQFLHYFLSGFSANYTHLFFTHICIGENIGCSQEFLYIKELEGGHGLPFHL